MACLIITLPNKWDRMNMPSRVEAAHNTGKNMADFFSKDKRGMSSNQFKELSTPNKKALGKYFGTL